MRYKRSTTAGGFWFFTVNLENRNEHLLTRNIGVLREVIGKVRLAHPFTIIAMVVLPEHLHAVWRLPPGDSDFPRRWSLIKAGFSRRIEAGEPVSASRLARRERGIWQRRYWEHEIRHESDLARHVDYIHFNPVKHGWVRAPAEWPHSSFGRYVAKGMLPADWGGKADSGSAAWGER
jgi:putative transposase